MYVFTHVCMYVCVCFRVHVVSVSLSLCLSVSLSLCLSVSLSLSLSLCLYTGILSMFEIFGRSFRVKHKSLLLLTAYILICTWLKLPWLGWVGPGSGSDMHIHVHVQIEWI